MGKALADAFAGEPRRRSTRSTPRSAFPLSRLCFEGPEADLQLTANTQPAILAASIAAWRALEAAGHPPGLRRRAQPRRVLGAGGGGGDRPRRSRGGGAPSRPVHAGGGAGRRGGDGGHPRPRPAGRSRPPAARPPRGRWCRRPTSTPRDRSSSPATRKRSSAPARWPRWRAPSARCPFPCPPPSTARSWRRRRSAWPGTSRPSRSTIPRCPLVNNVDALRHPHRGRLPRRTGPPGLGAGTMAGGRRRRWRAKASTPWSRSGRARCSPAW